MTTEPRTQHDYGQRQIEAARRVLIDLGQVLGSWFADSIVVVGGWVPELDTKRPTSSTSFTQPLTSTMKGRSSLSRLIFSKPQ